MRPGIIFFTLPMGNTSATGVCFSRDAATGEDIFVGEYLINAQGEDVVAGIRTPQQITKEGSRRWAVLAGVSEADRVAKYPSMEESMPEIYKELDALQTKLENHYKDMQDMILNSNRIIIGNDSTEVVNSTIVWEKTDIGSNEFTYLLNFNSYGNLSTESQIVDQIKNDTLITRDYYVSDGFSYYYTKYK